MMGLDQGLGNAQAQTCACASATPRAVGSIETLKKVSKVVWFDCGSGVVDGNLGRFAHVLGGYGNPTLRWGVLESVVKHD